ncbi:hypothetical protein [Acidithiobacillus acidisediminis]|uniref:helix-turn-helix transcriptional regulator n=1 Tax=Acidithiobacillus TaxID=119977 RepID=UPI00200EE22E|nr:hypothetical protein [Acidithiobacillus sp. S30A2]
MTSEAQNLAKQIERESRKITDIATELAPDMLNPPSYYDPENDDKPLFTQEQQYRINKVQVRVALLKKRLSLVTRPQVRLLQRVPATRTTTRARRSHGASSRSSAASAESGSDGDGDGGDGEPPQSLISSLLDQNALAQLLCVSKKTLQNQYSKNPFAFPPAIAVPGARGPRWTLASIQAWIANRPTYLPPAPPLPTQQKRRGRPRLALVARGAKGGAA